MKQKIGYQPSCLSISRFVVCVCVCVCVCVLCVVRVFCSRRPHH